MYPMTEAILLVNDQLNDFLPKSKKGKSIICTFNGNPSVKHLIESQGIPHTEIGQILVNDLSVEFNCKVHFGDLIEVFPASPQLDLLAGLYSNGKITFEPCFVLDNHLGKLATYLRIFGFDANYRNDIQDDELVEISSNADRILLTRDRQLLMHKTIRYGYWVRALISKEAIVHKLEPLTKRYFDDFRICPECDQIYWKGSHYERMVRLIDRVLSNS
jgi:uncharacterized protein with PIN domain